MGFERFTDLSAMRDVVDPSDARSSLNLEGHPSHGLGIPQTHAPRSIEVSMRNTVIYAACASCINITSAYVLARFLVPA